MGKEDPMLQRRREQTLHQSAEASGPSAAPTAAVPAFSAGLPHVPVELQDDEIDMSFLARWNVNWQKRMQSMCPWLLQWLQLQFLQVLVLHLQAGLMMKVDTKATAMNPRRPKLKFKRSLGLECCVALMRRWFVLWKLVKGSFIRWIAMSMTPALSLQMMLFRMMTYGMRRMWCASIFRCARRAVARCSHRCSSRSSRSLDWQTCRPNWNLTFAWHGCVAKALWFWWHGWRFSDNRNCVWLASQILRSERWKARWWKCLGLQRETLDGMPQKVCGKRVCSNKAWWCVLTSHWMSHLQSHTSHCLADVETTWNERFEWWAVWCDSCCVWHQGCFLAGTSRACCCGCFGWCRVCGVEKSHWTETGSKGLVLAFPSIWNFCTGIWVERSSALSCTLSGKCVHAACGWSFIHRSTSVLVSGVSAFDKAEILCELQWTWRARNRDQLSETSFDQGQRWTCDCARNHSLQGCGKFWKVFWACTFAEDSMWCSSSTGWQFTVVGCKGRKELQKHHWPFTALVAWQGGHHVQRQGIVLFHASSNFVFSSAFAQADWIPQELRNIGIKLDWPEHGAGKWKNGTEAFWLLEGFTKADWCGNKSSRKSTSCSVLFVNASFLQAVGPSASFLSAQLNLNSTVWTPQYDLWDMRCHICEELFGMYPAGSNRTPPIYRQLCSTPTDFQTGSRAHTPSLSKAVMVSGFGAFGRGPGFPSSNFLELQWCGNKEPQQVSALLSPLWNWCGWSSDGRTHWSGGASCCCRTRWKSKGFEQTWQNHREDQSDSWSAKPCVFGGGTKKCDMCPKDIKAVERDNNSSGLWLAICLLCFLVVILAVAFYLAWKRFNKRLSAQKTVMKQMQEDLFHCWNQVADEDGYIAQQATRINELHNRLMMYDALWFGWEWWFSAFWFWAYNWPVDRFGHR